MSVDLFGPYELSGITLKNRVVMCPLTRSRAIGNVPNDLMATYYGQRAGAGLIITEGTSPSPNGIGYARIPGIYSPEQVAGWKQVTSAVHQRGGRIFIQLMHTGRIGHPANMPAGAEILAPSAIRPAGAMWTDASGAEEPFPTPRAMNQDDIRHTIDEYAQAARNAIEAGFDGVELHGANGYLIDQFLNPGANQRDDAYGGSPENRNRFALEVARATIEAIGKERVGIRLSPYGVFNDQIIFDETDAQYIDLAKGLSALGLVYVHLVDMSPMGAPKPAESVVRGIRDSFAGALILSGGYDRARAEVDLTEGRGDLIAFGRPFISNPDLVERLASGAALAAPDHTTFYTPGEKGYTDYPALPR